MPLQTYFGNAGTIAWANISKPMKMAANRCTNSDPNALALPGQQRKTEFRR